MASALRIVWRRISAPTLIIFFSSISIIAWTFYMVHQCTSQQYEYKKLVEEIRIRDENAHARALDNMVISSNCKAISPVKSPEAEEDEHDRKYRAISDDVITGSIQEEVDFSRVLLHHGRSVLKVMSKKTVARKLGISREHITPNVVHYFWPRDKRFTFQSHISLLSVERFVEPQYIVIHGAEVPTGLWWEKTLAKVPNVVFMKRHLPWKFSGIEIQSVSFATELARIETILDYGGIVLDPDVVILKPFEAYRTKSCVMGRQSTYILGQHIMVGKRGAPFLRLLLEGYRSALLTDTTKLKSIASTLAEVYPNLIDIDDTFYMQPDKIPTLLSNRVDWNSLHAILLKENSEAHLPSGPKEIAKMDSAVGEIMRFVYYESKEKHA